MESIGAANRLELSWPAYAAMTSILPSQFILWLGYFETWFVKFAAHHAVIIPLVIHYQKGE